MDERTFTNNAELDETKPYKILYVRSNIAKEIQETEAKFGVRVVAVAFGKKESGKPDYNLELIIDEGDKDE